MLQIEVDCYAGYRGEQTPRALRIGENTVAVVEVVDQWLAPDHRYFKIKGDDGAMYVIRHHVTADRWELTVYDRRGAV